MSIEALLERVAVAIERNTESVEKMNAGRDAALEQLNKVAADGGAKPATRSRKKANDSNGADEENVQISTTTDAAGNAAAGATSTTTAAPSTAPANPTGPSDDDLRNAAQAYIGGAGDDVAARQARGGNLKAILDNFGVTKLVGPEGTGITDPDQRQQALFYLKRYDAGCTVDFSQDYDFSGDPTQGGLEPAATGADEFDIG